MVIPNFLLNTKIHARSDVGIGTLYFIFQIASLASSPSDVYERIGIGFWGGIILVVTGVTSIRAAERESSFLLGCSFILSIFALLASFFVMCVFAASVDEMKRYSSNPCTGNFIVPKGDYMGETELPIPPCSYYSSPHLAFDYILLFCGVTGILANVLLAISIFTLKRVESRVTLLL